MNSWINVNGSCLVVIHLELAVFSCLCTIWDVTDVSANLAKSSKYTDHKMEFPRFLADNKFLPSFLFDPNVSSYSWMFLCQHSFSIKSRIGWRISKSFSHKRTKQNICSSTSSFSNNWKVLLMIFLSIFA